MSYKSCLLRFLYIVKRGSKFFKSLNSFHLKEKLKDFPPLQHGNVPAKYQIIEIQMRLHKIFGPINSRAYAICRANSELNVRPWKSFSEEKKV